VIGKTVSHYKIISKLGEGGMGVVYKALDTSLDRHVAIKFLPLQLVSDKNAKKRFIREAKAASALNHANIAVVHEIDETPEGQTFMVMACYEGQTLKDKLEGGPLSADGAIAIVSQIALGLTKAHEKGIFHRDIKPGNILMGDDGQAKLADFGLAKLTGQTRITKTGTTVGTVAYMSPEQARGEETDARSDIWSLGVILFEMLTGKLPFRGDVEPALLYSIINEDPELVTTYRKDVPESLERIVARCLVKRSAERYETAAGLVADLEQMSHGVLDVSQVSTPSGVDAGGIKSLAVLPFVTTGGGADTEYLSEELPASIMNDLSRLSSLRVVSRNSAFRFTGQDEDLKTIGRRLNVGTVLTGSIRVIAEEISVTAELVNVVADRQLWGDRYVRKLVDVLSLEKQIASEISSALKLKLTGADRDRLQRRYTVSADAHGLYLKGRHSWNKRSEEELKHAAEYFRTAVDIDPDYALAHSGLADCYIVLAGFGFLSPAEAFPKAKSAALRALEIDNSIAEAHASLAFVTGCYEWDWIEEGRRYKHAIELGPTYATTLHWYSFHLVRMGLIDEAISVSRRAVDLDPLSLQISVNLGYWYFVAGEYDKSRKQCLKAIETDPNYHYAHTVLGIIHAQKGKYEEALDELAHAADLSGGGPENLAYLGYAYALAGMEENARKILKGFAERAKNRYVSPCFSALIHAGFGEKNKTIEWLYKAYEERDYYLSYQLFEPCYDFLRNDTRFSSLLLRMGPGPLL
jgi:serine/threonine-protein kinase